METKSEGVAIAVAKTSETETKHVVAPETSGPAVVVEEFPDPEEDDLDDLDDMLDEFSATSIETKEQAPSTSGPGRPGAATVVEDDGLTDDDFAKQLQAGMADLFGDLGNDPDMKAQFENMLKELGGAGLGEDLEPAPAGAKGQLPSSSTKSAAPAVGEESFQETIKKTMERMQASGDKATAAAAEDDSDDILAELMKQMGAGALDGEGGEEDFSKMLLGMMEQLTNKDILYEPMKELDDKFPDWMEKNREKTPAADLKRYEEQRTVVREIVAKFEEKTYKDENVADREYIVERMQKMQAAGSPPPDLVGDMTSAQEALGAPDEGCPQQ